MDLNENIQKNKDITSLYNRLSRELVLKVYNFALKIRKEENIGQRNIAREIKKRFGIDISENTISGWIHKLMVPYAQQRTQFKPKIRLSNEDLYELYIGQNLSASKIANKFEVSTIIVIRWLKSYDIKVRTHTESMNTLSIKNELADLKFKRPTIDDYHILTPEKAYILGVLCGDGYIDKRRIFLEIRKDEEFIKEFSNCMEKVYGLKYKYVYKVKRNTFLFNISAMVIAKDLLRYGDFKTFSWNVPEDVLHSENKEVIAYYLRGMFDSEGSINTYYITLTSCSYNGLIGMSQLLAKLGIENKIKKGRYSKLSISRKRNLKLFRDFIGFTIKRKMERLYTTYKRGW